MVYDVAQGAELSSRGTMEIQVELEKPLIYLRRDVRPTFSRNYNSPIKFRSTCPRRGAGTPSRHGVGLVKDFYMSEVG